MATNLRALPVGQGVLPWFEKAARAGHLPSSINLADSPLSGWAHYGASKAASSASQTPVHGARPLQHHINAVCRQHRHEGLEGLGQAYLDTMAASIPLKRLGAVEDIGNAALFFASDEAGYITGQQIIVDGGQTLPESLEAIAGI